MLAEESLKKRPDIFRDAMNLQGKAGRPASENEQHWQYAVNVFLLMAEGINKTKAVEDVAKEVNKSEKVIWDAVKEHKSNENWIKKAVSNRRFIEGLVNK